MTVPSATPQSRLWLGEDVAQAMVSIPASPCTTWSAIPVSTNQITSLPSTLDEARYVPQELNDRAVIVLVCWPSNRLRRRYCRDLDGIFLGEYSQWRKSNILGGRWEVARQNRKYDMHIHETKECGPMHATSNSDTQARITYISCDCQINDWSITCIWNFVFALA